MHLPGWPGGDPDALRGTSKAWATLRDQLTAVVDDAQPAMTDLFATWEGDAGAAFHNTWNDFAALHHKAASGADAISTTLADVAGKLDEAHKKYEHMVEAMAATAVVGIGLAIFTAGLSAAAGAAAGAVIAGEVTDLLVELGVELATVEAAASAIATSIGAATEAIVGAAVDFSIGFTMSAGDQALNEALDHEPLKISWDQALLSGATAAVLGPLAGGKGVALRMAIGAATAGVSGAVGQALAHMEKGEPFNADALLAEMLFGAASGGAVKGAPGTTTETEEIDSLLEGLAKNPAVSDMINANPDWLTVFSSNPEIMRVVMSESSAGVVVITPESVTTMVASVRTAVIDITAPESLAKYSSEEMVRAGVLTGIDASKETAAKVIEFEVKEAGGIDAVNAMSPDQLQALAKQAVAQIAGGH